MGPNRTSKSFRCDAASAKASQGRGRQATAIEQAGIEEEIPGLVRPDEVGPHRPRGHADKTDEIALRTRLRQTISKRLV